MPWPPVSSGNLRSSSGDPAFALPFLTDDQTNILQFAYLLQSAGQTLSLLTESPQPISESYLSHRTAVNLGRYRTMQSVVNSQAGQSTYDSQDTRSTWAISELVSGVSEDNSVYHE